MDSVQVVEERSVGSSKNKPVFCEECGHFYYSDEAWQPLCLHTSNATPHPVWRDRQRFRLLAAEKNTGNDCPHFSKKEPKLEPKISWIRRLLDRRR